MNIQFTRTPIVAKTRKLNAKFTPKVAQDINVMQGMDFEKILMFEMMNLQYMDILV